MKAQTENIRPIARNIKVEVKEVVLVPSRTIEIEVTENAELEQLLGKRRYL